MCSNISIAASVDMNKKSVKHEFSFDQVFQPNSIQEDIFELVSPLIQSALDGYNVCIFAYGQTGECLIRNVNEHLFISCVIQSLKCVIQPFNFLSIHSFGFENNCLLEFKPDVIE